MPMMIQAWPYLSISESIINVLALELSILRDIQCAPHTFYFNVTVARIKDSGMVNGCFGNYLY